MLIGNEVYDLKLKMPKTSSCCCVAHITRSNKTWGHSGEVELRVATDFEVKICQIDKDGFVWWNVIKRYRLMENDWEELDLSGTGKLYCCIPRRTFRSLRYLNLASTLLSSRLLQQMTMIATYLERLDISNCPKLDQIAIFKAKEHMQELLHIAISGNRQFTILVIACLCSCPELVTIEAHGLEFSAEGLLFLSKTFKSARSGSLQIETDESYDALCITNIFERELF